MKVGQRVTYRIADSTRTGIIKFIDWQLEVIHVRLSGGNIDVCCFDDVV